MKKAEIDKIRKYGRRTILETVRDEENPDIRYQVVQYTFPVFHSSDALAIEFDNNGSYIYSAVYTDPHKHFQPVYQVSQRMTDAYFHGRGLEKALVLGCAGCTIPRFLVLHYKNCKVIGLEYSGQFVEIAKRFFFNEQMKERFELINADAFAYVDEKQGKERFGLIYTDIYVGDIIHPNVYTNSFTEQIYDMLEDDGLAVINSFRVPFDRIKSFAESIKAPFGAVYIIEQYRKYYVALAKTGDSRILGTFEQKLPKYAVINMKITR